MLLQKQQPFHTLPNYKTPLQSYECGAETKTVNTTGNTEGATT